MSYVIFVRCICDSYAEVSPCNISARCSMQRMSLKFKIRISRELIAEMESLLHVLMFQRLAKRCVIFIKLR